MFFLLHDNCSNVSFVYSHIPKTGGTTIRGGGEKYKPLFKLIDQSPTIKDNWKYSFSFTVHRHPFIRFLSAFSDFKDNRKSNITLESVIKELDRFDYEKAKKDTSSFEHHILPQTHSLWGSEQMKHTLFQENLNRDLCDVLKKYHIKNPVLPTHRTSKSQHYTCALTDEYKSKLYSFYKNDFEKLHYNLLLF